MDGSFLQKWNLKETPWNEWIERKEKGMKVLIRKKWKYKRVKKTKNYENGFKMNWENEKYKWEIS